VYGDPDLFLRYVDEFWCYADDSAASVGFDLWDNPRRVRPHHTFEISRNGIQKPLWQNPERRIIQNGK